MEKGANRQFRAGPVLLAAVFFLGLFLRLQYVNTVQIDNPFRADAGQYIAYGYNLAHFGVFSRDRPPSLRADSFRSPGYPFFLALCFKVGGNERFYWTVVYAQALFGALLILLTYFMAIHFLPAGVAICAAALVAFSPHLVSMASYILTETVFGFFLAASLFLFLRGMKCGRIIYFIISGILWGYTYLVNETALFLPFILVATAMIKRKADHAGRSAIAVFLIIFSVFPVCWTVRNTISVKSDSLRGGMRASATISHGTYPGFVYKDPKFKYYPYREDPRQPEFGSSFENLGKILWSRVKQRPLRYISWYLFEKPYYLWSWDNLQSQTAGKPQKGTGDIYVYPVRKSLYYESRVAAISRTVMKILHPPILLSALAGVFLLIFSGRKSAEFPFHAALFAVIAYYTLLYSIFAPWPRYSVPLRPELYLFALWSAHGILGLTGKRSRLE